MIKVFYIRDIRWSCLKNFYYSRTTNFGLISETRPRLFITFVVDFLSALAEMYFLIFLRKTNNPSALKTLSLKANDFFLFHLIHLTTNNLRSLLFCLHEDLVCHNIDARQNKKRRVSNLSWDFIKYSFIHYYFIIYHSFLMSFNLVLYLHFLSKMQ